MYVIFDRDDRYTFGDTLNEAIDDWKDVYDETPDYRSVTVVQGTEKKFKIDLVDANPPKPVQAAKKPVANKATVSKSK